MTDREVIKMTPNDKKWQKCHKMTHNDTAIMELYTTNDSIHNYNTRNKSK